jgi:hypothetical protein
VDCSLKFVDFLEEKEPFLLKYRIFYHIDFSSVDFHLEPDICWFFEENERFLLKLGILNHIDLSSVDCSLKFMGFFEEKKSFFT